MRRATIALRCATIAGAMQWPGVMLVVAALWFNATSGQAVTAENVVSPWAGGGVVVAQWTFSRPEDVDFDGQPEGWKRKSDRDHPAYLKIGIVAHDEGLLGLAQAADREMLASWDQVNQWSKSVPALPPLPALPPSIADLVVDRHLRIELNGGWAMMQSPPVNVNSLYRYRLELSAMTESLKFDHAAAELVFLDAASKVVGEHMTRSLTGTRRWSRIASNIVAAPASATTAVVRLYLRPTKVPGETDIYGAVGFDNIMLRRLPQMQVETDQRLAVYDVGQRPSINVRVLGLDSSSAAVRLVVRDAWDKELASQSVTFQTGESLAPTSVTTDDIANANTTTNASESLPAPAATDAKPLPTIAGTATWQLPEFGPGFYKITASLGDAKRPTLSSETTFAIVANLSATAAGANLPAIPFGWTLPATLAEDVDLKRVPDWLQRLGVGVVKYPCWFAPEDRAELDDAAWFVGRLQEKNIRTIGLLDEPPDAILAKIDERERREPVAANFFRDALVWQPLLEPIMTRLTLKVRTWQLGRDGDVSFLGRPQLRQTVKDITRELQGFGQPIGVAISWPWLEAQPPVAEQSWAANNLSTATPLAPEELDAYLQATETSEAGERGRAETWVALNPLSESQYDLSTRVSDLILRMVTVRGHRVTAAFATMPVDPAEGLLRPDWRPDELLLPWRTSSLLIGDLSRVGALPLGGGSSSTVMANPTRTTIVVWNPTPTTERVYLGDSIRQVDAWGNAIVPKRTLVDGKPIHQIEVGPVPTFLVDVDPVLVAFRMSTQLVETNLDSLLGRRQTVSIRFNNPTREVMSGEVRLKPLADWEVDPRPQPFDLPPGRTTTQTFDVLLRNSAKIGESNLEFDFMLRTQPQRRFSVVRSIHVGPEGLDIEVTTRISGDELLVLLTMTNRTDQPQQYDCLLFPPGVRQYQRRQIAIPGGATVKRLFPWSDGQSLVGQKMLLRAVEQNGDRVLNYSVEATP